MAVKSKTEGTTTNLGNEQYSATDAEAAPAIEGCNK